jgi:hypothetical protein
VGAGALAPRPRAVDCNYWQRAGRRLLRPIWSTAARASAKPRNHVSDAALELTVSQSHAVQSLLWQAVALAMPLNKTLVASWPASL